MLSRSHSQETPACMLQLPRRGASAAAAAPGGYRRVTVSPVIAPDDVYPQAAIADSTQFGGKVSLQRYARGAQTRRSGGAAWRLSVMPRGVARFGERVRDLSLRRARFACAVIDACWCICWSDPFQTSDRAGSYCTCQRLTVHAGNCASAPTIADMPFHYMLWVLLQVKGRAVRSQGVCWRA